MNTRRDFSFSSEKKIVSDLAGCRLCPRQLSERGLDFSRTLGAVKARAIGAFTPLHRQVERERIEVLPLLSEQRAKRGLRIYPQLNVIMTVIACQYHY